MATVMRISPILPWDRVPEEESRFRRILLVMLIVLMLASAVITWIKLPPPPRVIKPVVPDRLVKLVVEQKALPPPPVEVVKVEEPKPEEPKPVEATKPEEKPEVAKVTPTEPADGKPAGPSVAKEKARAAIAVFDSLADLRSEAAPAARPGKPLTTATSPSLAGPGDAPSTQRALISDRAKAGSGGIVTAKASVDQGGGTGIAGGGTSRVVSGIGGSGGDGSGIGGAPASATANAANAGKASGARRTDENIHIGFQSVHGSLQALYQRALRNNPELQGKVTFRVEIQPDGSVSAAEVVASDLNDPELERKLLAKVRQIDFGAMNVTVWKDTYRVDFFPT